MGRDALEIITEAADELECFYDYQHQLRDTYPFMQRKYDRDMILVKELRNLLTFP